MERKEAYRQSEIFLLLGESGIEVEIRLRGVVLGLVGDESSKGAITLANGRLGETKLLEALRGHVLGLALGEEVVPHTSALDEEDGICKGVSRERDIG